MEMDEIKARVLAALQQAGATSSTATQVMERVNQDPNAPKIDNLRDVVHAITALYADGKVEFVAPPGGFVHGKFDTPQMRAK